MSKKIDFAGLGIAIPVQTTIDPMFDSYDLCIRFRLYLRCFGLTDDDIRPMQRYYLDALFHEKPWPPEPPFDAPEYYTGPTFDE